MNRLAGILLAAVLLSAPAARAQSLPYVYDPTIGTSPAQILPNNPLRKALIFFNPSAGNTCAVCPAVSRRNSGAVTCALNGAGSFPLAPGAQLRLEGWNWGAVPLLPSAWNGVCSSSTGLTALEIE
jgi:hypothetical protein